MILPILPQCPLSTFRRLNRGPWQSEEPLNSLYEKVKLWKLSFSSLKSDKKQWLNETKLIFTKLRILKKWEFLVFRKSLNHKTWHNTRIRFQTSNLCSNSKMFHVNREVFTVTWLFVQGLHGRVQGLGGRFRAYTSKCLNVS